MRAGKRAFDFDNDAAVSAARQVSRASDQERGEEGDDFGEVRHGPSRNFAADDSLLYIPKIFRALAFSTFGRISSRMSSLAKSASQRSGVITGQSEPNSILSCRIELM